MKDQVFAGRDISEALDLAAQTLGVGRDSLRYVVLDAGRPAGLGVGATPARVAVLLDAAPSPARAVAAGGEDGRRSSAATLRTLVRSLAEAAQLDLSAEVSESPDSIEVRLLGSGQEFFEDPEEEVLPALEHLLRKVMAQAGEDRRLLVSCEAVRARRDQAVRERALSLAREVARDGQPRETEPLNSYERRLVHIAVAEAGLTSYSVGEGNGRRVVVALGEKRSPDAES